MKNVVVAVFAVICLLFIIVGSKVHAKSAEPRTWVDVTHQSPNIFTTADPCPKDHPAQLWLLEEKYNSNSHRIRVCGQYNSKGEVLVSDEDGRIINP